DEIRPWLEPGEGQRLFGAPGCDECHRTGYASRTGVFEILRISREVRRLISEGKPTLDIRRKAAEEGFLELRRSAMLKVARGLTAPEEVLRAIPSEYLGIDE
ncbi:ATPase, T2SS/T4P/T4SS family, partial [Singulisphaera rosea]